MGNAIFELNSGLPQNLEPKKSRKNKAVMLNKNHLNLELKKLPLENS